MRNSGSKMLVAFVVLGAVIKTLPLISEARGQNSQSSPHQQKMANTKQNLARRVEIFDVDAANIIRGADSEIAQISTPFFRAGKIYRVSKFLPTRPIVFFIGVDEKDFAVILNANPPGYFALAEKSGLLLHQRALRLAYAQTFLETTESANKRFQFLQSVNEIKERPNLNEKEKVDIIKFQAKYEKIVTPPFVSDTTPYKAVFFVIEEQNLLRLNLTVSSNGKIQVKKTVLERNLLIPYAL